MPIIHFSLNYNIIHFFLVFTPLNLHKVWENSVILGYGVFIQNLKDSKIFSITSGWLEIVSIVREGHWPCSRRPSKGSNHSPTQDIWLKFSFYILILIKKHVGLNKIIVGWPRGIKINEFSKFFKASPLSEKNFQ